MKLTKGEALTKSMVQSASKGSVQAFKALSSLAGKHQHKADHASRETADDSARDQEIIKHHLSRRKGEEYES